MVKITEPLGSYGRRHLRYARDAGLYVIGKRAHLECCCTNGLVKQPPQSVACKEKSERQDCGPVPRAGASGQERSDRRPTLARLHRPGWTVRSPKYLTLFQGCLQSR